MTRTRAVVCGYGGYCEATPMPGAAHCPAHLAAGITDAAHPEKRAPSLFDDAHVTHESTTSLAAQPARARSSDIDTSRAAAAIVTLEKQTELQDRIVAAFRARGDMTDPELIAYLERAYPHAEYSPSGVRSRRAELSNPNMDRLDQIAVDFEYTRFAEASPMLRDQMRQQLRTEGFKSPLWDTGRRAHVAGSRSRFAVWGLAR